MSATNQFPPPHLIPENDGDDNDEAMSSANNTRTDKRGTAHAEQQQLALSVAESDAQDSLKVDVSSTDEAKYTLRFDSLGPLVVNRDGTLSRIHNWSQMTDAERERTVRVLGKRNMLRKEAILKGDEAGA